MKELDKNRPVMLTDGREVRNICFDYKLPDYTTGICAIIRAKDDSSDYIGIWDAYGRPHASMKFLVPHLINVPERIEGWLNIINTYKYPTKQDADNNAGNGRVACIYINVL